MFDPIGDFQTGNWTPIQVPQDPGLVDVTVSRYNLPTGIASVMKGPEILVIGGYENGVYEQVFRLFNSGLIEFQHATIIEGTQRIDDYSLEELEVFELVFLHGYGYKNRGRAWKLLEDYVKGGGALCAETGWQYRVPDWEPDNAPAPLPVANLEWTTIDQEQQLQLNPDLDWAAGNTQQFASMLWEDQPWGVSSPTGGILDWAQPVLTASGEPLVAAGQYGNGKVVWSGMNLVGRINTYGSDEEEAFLQSLIFWLLPKVGVEFAERPVIRREHPDVVELTIGRPLGEGVNLLWRENHASGWRATARVDGADVELPIYRAGPGMMLMHLPATSADELVVTMEYSIDAYRWLGRGATGVTALILAGSVIWARSVLIGRKSSNCPSTDEGIVIGPDARRPSSPAIVKSREGLPDLDPPVGILGGAETDKAISYSPNPSLDAEDAWATKMLIRRADGEGNNIDGTNGDK